MFWPQEFTVGSDVRLNALMTAATSIGRHTIARDIYQAVLRLRQLPKGQNVNFIMTQEDKRIITAILNKELGFALGEADKLTFRHILLYALYTQSQRQGSDNYRSFKQKMQSVLREKVYSLVLDPNVSFEEMARIMLDCSELFMTEQRARPFNLYGRTKTLGAKEKVVQDDLEQMMNSRAMQAFRKHPLLKEMFSH